IPPPTTTTLTGTSQRCHGLVRSPGQPSTMSFILRGMEAPNAKLGLSPVTRRKLTETVAEQLLQAIRELPPGTRVPSERELTRELGVGRSTVREALNGIAMLGIVEIRHGQGVFVAEAPAGEGDPPAI